MRDDHDHRNVYTHRASRTMRNTGQIHKENPKWRTAKKKKRDKRQKWWMPQRKTFGNECHAYLPHFRRLPCRVKEEEDESRNTYHAQT